MKRAHAKQHPVTWGLLIVGMVVLTVACMLISDVGYRAAVAGRATALSELPFGIVTREVAEDYDLSDVTHGVQQVERGLDAQGHLVGWLLTVTSEGQGATTCTVVLSPDGNTLGGVREVSGSSGGRYYNIRVSLPYFTSQFEGMSLPLKPETVDMASGATGSSQAVVANIQTAAEFVNDVING